MIKIIKVKARVANPRVASSRSIVFKDGQLVVDFPRRYQSQEIYYILPCENLIKMQLSKPKEIEELLQTILKLNNENKLNAYFEKNIMVIIQELCDAIVMLKDADMQNEFYNKLGKIIEIYKNKLSELMQAKLSKKPYLTLEPESVLLYNCETNLKKLKNELTLYLQTLDEAKQRTRLK